MSVFLGFYLGKHDSNLAVSVNGRIRYRKSERYYGIKHHRADLSFILNTLNDWGISKLDGIAYSDGDRNNLGCAEGIFTELNNFDLLNNPPKYCLDHHYAHALSVWPLGEKFDVSISIDGNGDNYSKIKVFKEDQVLYDFKLPNISKVLTEIGILMHLSGLEIDYAGKVMGLSSYAEPLQILNNLLDKNLDILVKPFIHLGNDFFNFENYEFLRYVSGVHKSLEIYTLDLFDKFCSKDDVISFTGGCAQNTVINYLLIKKYPNLIIPPHSYDGGLSLGCLEFLRRKYSEPSFSKDGFPFWQDDFIEGVPSKETINRCADLISSGKIIGWAQGSGEIGPRALGNRSILFDPRNPKAKEVLNSRVKFREIWRPYAGSVLKHKALDYFDVESNPYMLYACKVKNDSIPGVTHVDGTCRFQSVESGVFFDLISSFENKTGIPVLLNTSLNIAGKPIASSKQQCLDVFNSTNIDAICIGNELFEK